MIFERKRLLARLVAPKPRLVRLSAPPGYGKTSLARLFARRFDRYAVCDCSGVTSTAGFAGRVLSALSKEADTGGESIALTRLALHVTQADAAAWSRSLLEIWKGRQERSLFILENADAIAGDDGAAALLEDMLAARPPERVLLVSSREPLPLRAACYLAPHQILTLPQSELRLETAEALAILETTQLAAPIVGRIIGLADGWPVALLLLARVAHYEANIDAFLDRLGVCTFAELHDYLVNEMLLALTPEMMSTMLATAAIPHASLEDIALATGIRHATPVIDGLLRLPGFISSDAGGYQMHPLLLEALRARHETDFVNYLSRAARETERSGDSLRAAELYAGSGNDAAAAAALERLPSAVLAQPSARLIEALARIPAPLLFAHPNIWMAVLRYRRRVVDTAQLYAESVGLEESLAPKGSPVLRRRLGIRRAMLAEGLDRLTEARAALKTAAQTSYFEKSPEEQRLVLMTSAVVAAKSGRFAEADQCVEEADALQGTRQMRFEFERAQIAMEKARLHGEWHDLLRMSEDALNAAVRGGPTARISEAARDVAWAAWYCNDDDRAEAALRLRADCGDDDRAAGGYALPVAEWHAALASADGKRAAQLFDEAVARIDTVENDFLRIAVRVSAALLLPAQRRRLDEARAIAQRIESPPLQASIELLIDSPEPLDYGIFKYLAARAQRSPLKVRREVLFIDIVRGHVRRGAERVHVSDRGLELLAALAILPAGTSRESLAAAMWPGLETKAALNSLKMCVSRTRTALADREAIRNTRHGYALNESVGVDLRELERLLRGIRGAASIGGSARREAYDAVNTLAAHARTHAAGWAWFSRHAAFLDDLHCELQRVLAQDGLETDFVKQSDRDLQPAATRRFDVVRGAVGRLPVGRASVPGV